MLANHYFKRIITYLVCSANLSDRTVADNWNVTFVVIEEK